MSTNYNGKPSLITYPAALTISSSTNATPIEVTVSAAHGLSDGDIVRVKTHSTNTAANGFWQVVVTASNKFTLKDPTSGANSVGNGVGGATGTVDLYTTGTYAIPADGDAIDASSANVGLETLGDRTARTLWRVPTAAQVLIDKRSATHTDVSAFHPADWNTGAGGNGAWAEDTVISGIIQPGFDMDVVNGDVIDLKLVTCLDNNQVGHGNLILGWFVHFYDYGTSPSFASATLIAGYETRVPDTLQLPISLHARVTASLTRGKGARFYVGAYQFAAARVYTMFGSYAFDATLRR